MMFLPGLIVGLVAGVALALFGLPLLAKRFPFLAELVRKGSQALPLPGLSANQIEARIDWAILDLEIQIRNRVDVDRNLVRLAQLKEVRDGEGQA